MIKLVLIAIILLIVVWNLYNIKDTFVPSYNIKTYVINLRKNVTKWEIIRDSNISDVKLERFDAIDGKTVNLKKWLNREGLRSLREVEDNGYRTAHYQLTRGAVGCFLSHYTLAKKLLEDTENGMYLILEDDAGLRGDTFASIPIEIKKASTLDWDIILLGTHRIHGNIVGSFVKVNGFWGTSGYLINKKGAKKLVKEVDTTKIDAQIDAYMSWMSQTGKLNLYASKPALIFDNNILNHSDIQVSLREKKGIDPFVYKGLKV